MTFKLLSKDKLKVTLTKQDMSAFGITFSELDYQDLKTKQVISYLLAKAKQETGFNANEAKVFIEVYPEGDGCCICFSTIASLFSLNTKVKTEINEPFVFLFATLEDVIKASIQLFTLYCHRIYKSSLYKLNDSYRLIIYPLDQSDRLSVDFLNEFGQLIGSGSILTAFIQEHAHVIIENNAIDQIYMYLS